VALVQRLAEQSRNAVLDVTGLPTARASQLLRRHGLTVTVIALGKPARRVSAQWPAPGEAPPSDGKIVLWAGTPAAPPPPPPPVAAPVMPLALPAAAPSPAAAPAPTTQPGGRTPGLEGFVPPPHGPRSNIRTLPAAPAGTTLAGRASWYGPGFAGHTTACGGVFNPAELTLASRELRCGTKVLVTGPAGSIEATVTDWGPAEWTQRRFDLSQATMAAVGGLGAGVVDVTVEVR
jgi:hypothetical protein